MPELRPEKYTYFDVLGKIIDFLLKGVLFSPWYLFKFFFGGFDFETLCIPWKAHCSMNGRNKGTACQLPYAIEIIAFIVTFLTYKTYGTHEHLPLAYMSKAQLEKVGALHSLSEYPGYAGGYRHSIAVDLGGKNSMTQMMYTLFDADSFNENLPKALRCNKDDLYKSDTGEELLFWKPEEWSSFNESGKLSQWDKKDEGGWGNNRGDACDIITLSRNCACRGVLDATGDLHKTCPSSDMKQEIIDNNGNTQVQSVAKCINVKSLATYQDIPPELQSTAGSTLKIALILALVISASRMGAFILCRAELRKPGAQWINGWWAAVAMLYCYSNFNKLYKFSRMGIDGSGEDDDKVYNMKYYIKSEFMFFGYQKEKDWGHVYAYDIGNEWLLKAKNLALIAAVCNMLCSFISSEAYCNDCTGAAYGQANIKRIKRREFRKQERARMQARGRKSLKVNY